MPMYDVIVIGGGASGLMAAIQAAKEGASVKVIDALPEYGKKITVTGNGKCNLTNKEAGIVSHYHTDDTEKLKSVLEEITPEVLIREFNALGLICREKNGYYYPYHENAALVRDLLGQRVYDFGGKIETGNFCRSITSALPGRDPEYEAGYHYFVHGDSCRTVIVATGSMAGGLMRMDEKEFMQFLNLSTSFAYLPYKPALTKCYVADTDKPRLDALKGLRMKGKVSLIVDDAEVERDYGEIQFTKDALSGIVVFQVSGSAAQALEENQKVQLKLDLLPEYSLEALETMLESRQKSGLTYAKSLLGGIFPEQLLSLLCKEVGVDLSLKKQPLSIEKAMDVLRLAKTFTFAIAHTGDLRESQVSRGGISLSHVSKELQYFDGENGQNPTDIFVCGEVLNVDGDCGGFNLHFAFASGIIAGRNAARRAKELC